MKSKFFVTIFILLSVMILFGCGQGTNGKESSEASTSEEVQDQDKNNGEKEDSKDLGDYNIQFSGEVVEDDGKFIIEGKSNLLPESRLVAELLVSEDEAFSDTTELVQDDGSFYMELEHHQFGEAEIVIRFDFENVQEDPIKRHYGEKGQKLEGPFIYKHDTWDGIFKKAEVKVHYHPDEPSELVLKAPDWEEQPADYGDPRVWIEVEELTEDGEFFYMRGKSNILEGSEIKVSYGNNRDKTQVLPDGTFTFKIDYEYLEDKDFIIEFKPSDFQWNEIEEAYGTEGQKLIGDLVETDKYNNYQYIEKHVPWDGKEAAHDKEQTEGADSNEEAADDEEQTDEADPSEKETSEEENDK